MHGGGGGGGGGFGGGGSGEDKDPWEVSEGGYCLTQICMYNAMYICCMYMYSSLDLLADPLTGFNSNFLPRKCVILFNS